MSHRTLPDAPSVIIPVAIYPEDTEAADPTLPSLVPTTEGDSATLNLARIWKRREFVDIPIYREDITGLLWLATLNHFEIERLQSDLEEAKRIIRGMRDGDEWKDRS